MAGKHNHNYKAFNEAKEYLQSQGFVVLSPTNTPKDNKITPAQYMDIDLAMIRACDAIYMLDGWGNSKGATVEYHYAIYLDIEIIFQEAQ